MTVSPQDSREALRGTGVSLHIVRPGFVRTKMTAGRSSAPFAVEAPRVASDIVRGLVHGQVVIWSPGILRWVFSAFRLLPRSTVAPLAGLRPEGRRRRSALVVVTAAAVMALVSQSSFASEPKLRTSALRRISSGRAVDPSYFEPGACVEYPPASGDRHLTVFLDAGHGGLDPGGVGETQSGQTIYEADETLPVELDTMKLLRTKGFTVVVSRTEAETVIRPQPGDVSGGLFTVQGEHDVAARDICANMAKANVLVGIYFDAGGSPYNAGAVTGYDTARTFSAQNLRLATLIQNDVLDAMKRRAGGSRTSGWSTTASSAGPHSAPRRPTTDTCCCSARPTPGGSAAPSQMPGALIEPLFITDPFEGTLAASPSGQEVIAGGLAQAIEQYLAPRPRIQNSEASTRRLAPRNFYRRTRAQVHGTSARQWLIVGAVVIGGILALVVAPKTGPWHAAGPGSHRGAAQLGSSGTPPSPSLLGQPLIMRPRAHPDVRQAMATALVALLRTDPRSMQQRTPARGAAHAQHQADRALTRPGRRPPRRP